MIKILKHLKLKEWLLILVSLVLIVGQVWLDFKLLSYTKIITGVLQDNAVVGSELNVSFIIENGLKMLLCALGSLLGAISVGFLMAKNAASFAERLRFEIFTKVDSFSTNEINKFSTASLITRSTNDVTQVQMFITMGAQLLIKAPILAVWAIIELSSQGYEWMLATGIALLLITALVLFIMLFVMPKFKKVQKITDDLTNVSRENLTGVRVVRAYNAEDYQEEKFEEVNTRLTKNNLFTSRGMSIMMPSMNVILNILMLSGYIIGAYLLNNIIKTGTGDASGTSASMLVFSQYAMQVVMAYMMLVMIFFILPRTSVSAKRINEVLDTNPTIFSGSYNEVSKDHVGEVEFRNVSFKYPDAEEYVIKDVSFKVKQGETIAFIGSTGSGKSTLINLVPRFYDVTDGEILINNVNVKDYDLTTLHNLLGYVPQKAVLFKGTVESNVDYGYNGQDKKTEQDIWKALEIAQGYNFINETEDKLEHEIAQAGTNLSGGQKQRIAIARAVARKPQIYIFDDSFSALDYQTDKVLRSALKKETKDVTSMIVAQRIGTIIDADQIVVLDKGKVVGIGKHRELLKTSDVYKEIAMSQLTEEELQ